MTEAGQTGGSVGGGPPVRDREAEERHQLRPYRRLVMAIFSIVLVLICVLILRGIVRHLDRLPSVAAIAKPKVVDLRALRACAEDLERLEGRVRSAAGLVFAALPPDPRAAAAGAGPNVSPMTWDELARPLEVERIGIVARCRLNEPSEDVAVRDLEHAAGQIEELMRSYALLYARHLEGGLPHALDARSTLERAASALKAR